VQPFAAVLAILLAASVLPCAAAPFATQLGEARIALDAPAGFTDTGFTGSPRLMELAEALTPASSRILLFAISDADLRRFMSGDPIDLRRYMIAATPKALERERVSPGMFKEFVAESQRALGEPAPSVDYAAYLDTQPEGKDSLLAELRKEAEVVSVLLGTRLPLARRGAERPQYVLWSNTFLLVRGKALSFSVYTLYDTPGDLDWLRAVTARWTEDVRRMNSR
jgi:hypothetical protein